MEEPKKETATDDQKARFARVAEIFDGARAAAGAEREAYLQEACGDDAELRSEVEGLLALDVPGDDLEDMDCAFESSWAMEALRSTADAGPMPVDEALPIPENIGSYTVLRELSLIHI